jgi:hypothetical protein
MYLPKYISTLEEVDHTAASRLEPGTIQVTIVLNSSVYSEMYGLLIRVSLVRAQVGEPFPKV